ncbi:MAG: acetylornithine/succinylornithine family transaminase, partial [Planctomycetes bacterium]|nr:acetylornithine/succinylornithine family transaminase [Planctomycetota bacterium]
MTDSVSSSNPQSDPTANVLANYGRFSQRFVSGQGSWLTDDRGDRYLDFLAGIAVNALGHSHPDLTAAISKQAGTLLHTSNLFNIAPQEAVATALCAQGAGDRVVFCNSGAEANETAFKAMRLWGNVKYEGRKQRIIAADQGFHGRSLGSLSLTGRPEYHKGFEPLFPVEFVPYGDAAALAEIMADDVAGVILEPLQGEGGVNVPPADYLQKVRDVCDKHESLLCIDEVQTGVGRTGKFFCFQYSDIQPDCVSVAKGLGGGVPIGACAMREEVAELFVPGTHGSTFGGNHLACAAAEVVIDHVCAAGFLDRVLVAGERIRQGLTEVFGDSLQEIRGQGLLIGAVITDMPKNILALALEEQLICGTAGGGVLRLAPPLNVSDD